MLLEGLPKCWKMAVITSIPKVRGASRPSEYRPISIECILAKGPESFVKEELTTHVEKKLHHLQFGNRRGRSTAGALLAITQRMHDGLNATHTGAKSNAARQMYGVAFDIRKAFDVVSHERLLCTLRNDFNVDRHYRTCPSLLRVSSKAVASVPCSSPALLTEFSMR